MVVSISFQMWDIEMLKTESWSEHIWSSFSSAQWSQASYAISLSLSFSIKKTMTNTVYKPMCVLFYFCWSIVAYPVVLVSTVQQWVSYRYTFIPTTPTTAFLDFLPIYLTTEHYVESPVLYNRLSLVIYFIHSIVAGRGTPSKARNRALV